MYGCSKAALMCVEVWWSLITLEPKRHPKPVSQHCNFGFFNQWVISNDVSKRWRNPGIPELTYYSHYFPKKAACRCPKALGRCCVLHESVFRLGTEPHKAWTLCPIWAGGERPMANAHRDSGGPWATWATAPHGSLFFFLTWALKPIQLRTGTKKTLKWQTCIVLSTGFRQTEINWCSDLSQGCETVISFPVKCH